MGEATKIQWTHHTFNPWWGCQRVSPGCEHCYAETFSKRVGLKVWGPTADRRVFGDKHWAEPRKWNRDAEKAGVRRRVFCASMADVFEDRRDLDSHRERLWNLIEETPWLDWLLLTKRPENIERLAPPRWEPCWPANVWLGVTAEDQAYYDKRWPIVARVRAAVLFVSHEPATGPLQIKAAQVHRHGDGYGVLVFPNWVITGGESGHGARPYDVEWARKIVRDTRETPVAAFVKQLGSFPVWNGCSGPGQHWPTGTKRTETVGGWRVKLRDAKGGDWSEWPEDLRIRQWPNGASLDRAAVEPEEAR